MRKIVSKKSIIGLLGIKIELGKIYGEFEIGKQTKMSHKKVQHLITTRVLELLHMDLMGPMQVEILGCH